MKRRMPICEIVDTSTGSGKLLPGLNRNLTPAQQIIYIYGPNQWKTQNNVDLIEKAGNDYLITPGIAAHKLHIRKLTWNKARKACIQEGGHLAIINSNSEEKILIRILEENKASEAWLGIHEFYEEGGWNTIMDESLEATGYSKWTKMYREDVKVPDDNDGSQHCGSLVVNGGLDNRDCNDVYAFFCEITF
ncbi:hemolymph lipopolysaccharide-binding protein-like isoform X1 [Formica exsecta]|uniref:hemolymph lipopolysaccharide-binding protein-like isoform X1 n=1 Tax=Formica exsecta TaxID=72781 RepID=UPI001144F557|nr:hemolymph lipopolysaccharide-binding protein-like isoform X1 [Formica exsecta]